jgi:hypothetical protein
VNVKEMQSDEDKVYTRSRTSFPSNQAKGMANTKFPQQSSKVRSVKGFGEKVSQLSLYVIVFYHYVSLLNIVSQEVVSHFYVFHSPMEN